MEAGIASGPVKRGFSIVPDRGKSISESAGLYYHIPLRTRAKIPLTGDWLFATVSFGVHLSVIEPTRVGSSLKSEIGESKIGSHSYATLLLKTSSLRKLSLLQYSVQQ